MGQQNSVWMGEFYLYGRWETRQEGMGRGWLLLMVCILAGICMGGWLVGTLQEEQLQELGGFFEDLSSLTRQEGVGMWALFGAIWGSGMRILVFLGFLGVTIFAPLLVPLLMVYRGMAIGFCGVCILQTVQEGAFVSLMANVVLCQMFTLPILLWWGNVSVEFSKRMLAQMRGECRTERVLEHLPLYLLRFALCAVGLALGTLVCAPLILWLSRM